MGPCDLRDIFEKFHAADGEPARSLETRGDAAVTPGVPGLCLVQTVDFFTPVADEPGPGGGSGGLPPARTIPGDIGWKPSPEDVDRGGERDGAPAVPEEPPGSFAGASRAVGPGLVLRLASIVPFLIAGVVGVVALVGWTLLFIFGFGRQESVWSWAAGRPAADVVGQVVLVLLLGLASVAFTVLAIWAGLRAFKPGSGVVFWTVAQVVFGALAVGMVVADRLAADTLVEVGLSRAEWWVLFAGVAASMVVARLRARAAQASARPGGGGRAPG